MVNFRLDVPPDIREILSYDPETGFFFKENCYFRSQSGRRADRRDIDGYYRVNVRGRLFFAHRLAWYFVHGELPPLLIDHINRDPGDNRIRNLRLATNSENMRNRGANAGRTLPKGVCLNRALGKYQASIGLNNRVRYIGVFDTIADAKAAYDSAAAALHGAFAGPL